MARRPSAQWPTGLDGIGYGGDYNPEQWPQATRLEDLELMRQAGVTIVSVAIFSWALLEPREGEYEFSWLDETLDRLHSAGIRVSLATATASPPAWLSRAHPEILPQRADGTVLWPGGRQHYRISSPVFRRYALDLTRRIAERYRDHPALAVWHVDNEIGCHVPHEYSDDAAAAFRVWLEARYGTIERLNEAWGTTFWSQRYDTFDEVLPPRTAPTFANPTQQLDFKRYSSDELLSYYRDLRDVLAEVTPDVPCTTNFMVMGSTGPMDYYSWAPELDIVSNDHYIFAGNPEPEVELAFSADMVRSIAGGDPWMLMEHSTSAVNWQGRNRTKKPGEMLRHSLAHVAHGADAIMFFQWRQSAAGAEKFHSAMLPHAGTDSDVWRNTVELGRSLRAIGEVRGSRVRARAAILFDFSSAWSAELDSRPTDALVVRDLALEHYRALRRRGVEVDVVRPSADLSGYDLVVVPALYLVSDADAANVTAAAERGASVLVTFFSGIADENDHVRLGGYPGAWRDLLGVRTEEFWPLQEHDALTLDDGARSDLWSEQTHVVDGTQVVRTFTGGDLDGWPALTRRPTSAGGAAWYLATRLDRPAVQSLVDTLIAESGVRPAVADLPDGVEVVRRHADDGRTWLFVINHASEPATLAVTGRELLTDATITAGALTVAAGGVAVVRETKVASAGGRLDR